MLWGGGYARPIGICKVDEGVAAAVQQSPPKEVTTACFVASL